MYKHFFKRIVDFLATFVVLLLISPLFVGLCVMVRLKLGAHIFFKQMRITKGDKPFMMIKFRTMSDKRDDNGSLLPDEERFTKFGNFLRNSSLDELPELFNVLKGDMSLIGPRPLYTDYLPYYTEEEGLRHLVSAGITGLAQINGRNLSKWNERFAYDIKYVRELSLINDIKILWRTFFKVASQEDIGQPSVDEELPLNIVRSVQQPEKVVLVKKINAKYGKTDTYIEDTKEIGGDYSLNEDSSKLSSDYCNVFANDRTQYVSTCRSAIREILDENEKYLGNMIAFVPSFTCHVCVEPFVEKGYQVYPYSLNKDLTIDKELLLADVQKYQPSVILIHSYFGINTLKSDNDLVSSLKKKGIIFIEDLTHGMWGEYSHLDAPYHIGSLRKWMEIPEGAFVQGLSKDLSGLKEDKELVEAKKKGMIEKDGHLKNLPDCSNYRKAQLDAEALLDTRHETFKMSSLSAALLNNLDKDSFKKKRRDNYNKLYDLLSECKKIQSVLERANKDDVPFMMPIYVPDNRKELQKHMIDNKIFPTIIWACPSDISDMIDDNAQYIYDHILCIHCDQRYDVSDMERISTTIYKFYNNTASL